MICNKRAIARAALVLFTLPCHAQQTPSPDPDPLVGVVVTGNPLSSDLFEMAAPASVLQGQGLILRRSPSLGETLNGLPGVSSTYFGPQASRPVIRGLDGDRIRILQNGTGMSDASAASFDHAVAVDPFIAEKIEVVRGPASLFYGGSAVGGVVNVIDGRIAQRPVQGVAGETELRMGGAERASDGAAKIKWGNSTLALHADVYSRRSKDLAIPGFARSARQRALDAPGVVQRRDRVPNSDGWGTGGGLGAALTFDDGFAGLSWQNLDSNYGSPAEPPVRLDMQSNRWDFSGEKRKLGGFFETVRAKFGQTKYQHQEVNAGIVGTVFKNDGYDGRIEATHGKLGPFSGAIGLQVSNNDFSALGAEAFIPATKTDSRALFLFEEVPVGDLKLNFGARTESTRVGSRGAGPIDASTGLPKFGAAQERSFSPKSSAVGAVYSFMPGWAATANYSSTGRAPTFGELYANGPHLATGAYEVGNSNFGIEKSTGLDLALRGRSGNHSGSVGVFRQRFRNYLNLFGTGNTRGADGELNPVDADGNGTADGSGAGIVNELVYRAVRAQFRGIEAQARFRLMDKGGSLDLELKADSVRATDLSTGAPLPRISPARYGVAFDYAWNRFSTRLDVNRVKGQDRVSAGELPTDGYTMVNLAVSQRINFTGGVSEIFLRGVNLTNVEARNHVSFLKDRVPLAGRGVQAGLRATF